MYPLLGIYLTANNTLLLLGEIALRLIGPEGDTIMSDDFDLIEDFNIENNSLIILTDTGEHKTIQLF